MRTNLPVIQVRFDAKLERFVRGGSAAAKRGLDAGMTELVRRLHERAAANITSGGSGLQSRSGSLVRSLLAGYHPGLGIGKVGYFSLMGYQRIAGQNPDSSQFRYARIHEFGSGYLPGGVIRPLTAPFLVFRVNSSQNIVKTGVTFSPGAVNQVWVRTKQVRIPARPFLRPAANGIRSEVRQVMNKAIADAIGGV